MKEGQPQEPVRGMKEILSEKIDYSNYKQLAEDCWLFLTNDKLPNKASIKKEAFLHEISVMIESAVSFSTPPPAPINTEGEDKKANPQKVLHDNIKGVAGLNDLTIWHKEFIYKAMREYAASNPQSSTEEEKDLCKALNKIIDLYPNIEDKAIIALNDIRQTAFDALNKISKR